MKTKKLLLTGTLSSALIIIGLFGCKDKANETKETQASASVANYPCTIEHPDNWEMGDPANTMIALRCLKAWEEGKIDESISYFGDSVHVEFDGIDKKMSNDSLKVFLGSGWNKTIKEKIAGLGICYF